MALASTAALRVLDPGDRGALLSLAQRDPVGNVIVIGRVASVGLDPWRLGGEVWGWFEEGVLTAACWSGANLVPVEAQHSPAALAAFAERALRQGRRCSSIVGPAAAVVPLWQALEPRWGPAREVRDDQPLCVIDGPPAIAPDPLVRPVRRSELDTLLPASIAMFTEEVGVSPVGRDGGALYRARVGDLVAAGRAFARIEDGRVVFKAEVGSASEEVCQVQGVWVAPDRRGEGLSRAGMAAVVELARAAVAPVVSLYVNCYNAPARAAYARVGFREVGTFASVLF